MHTALYGPTIGQLVSFMALLPWRSLITYGYSADNVHISWYFLFGSLFCHTLKYMFKRFTEWKHKQYEDFWSWYIYQTYLLLDICNVSYSKWFIQCDKKLDTTGCHDAIEEIRNLILLRYFSWAYNSCKPHESHESPDNNYNTPNLKKTIAYVSLGNTCQDMSEHM